MPVFFRTITLAAVALAVCISSQTMVLAGPAGKDVFLSSLAAMAKVEDVHFTLALQLDSSFGRADIRAGGDLQNEGAAQRLHIITLTEVEENGRKNAASVEQYVSCGAQGIDVYENTGRADQRWKRTHLQKDFSGIEYQKMFGGYRDNVIFGYKDIRVKKSDGQGAVLLLTLDNRVLAVPLAGLAEQMAAPPGADYRAIKAFLAALPPIECEMTIDPATGQVRQVKADLSAQLAAGIAAARADDSEADRKLPPAKLYLQVDFSQYGEAAAVDLPAMSLPTEQPPGAKPTVGRTS